MSYQQLDGKMEKRFYTSGLPRSNVRPRGTPEKFSWGDLPSIEWGKEKKFQQKGGQNTGSAT